MTKLEPKTAQALTNLRASQDFQVVLEWLAQWEEQELDTCVTSAMDAPLLRAQGAVRTLRELRKAYDTAPTLNEKFRIKEKTR